MSYKILRSQFINTWSVSVIKMEAGVYHHKDKKKTSMVEF